MLRVLAFAGVFTLVMGWRGLQWMPCPFLQVTHLPCPGCGLTRACVMLLQGDWRAAMHMHAMAPLFLAVIAVLLVAALQPSRRRLRWAASVARIEQATMIVPLLLTMLCIYWIVRLGYRLAA